MNDDDFSTIFADIEGPGIEFFPIDFTMTSVYGPEIFVYWVENFLSQLELLMKMVYFAWSCYYCMTFHNHLLKVCEHIDALSIFALWIHGVPISFLYSYTFVGYFLTKIFHPNIAINGEICVNTLKKDWNPSLGLRHVLLVSSPPVPASASVIMHYPLCGGLLAGIIFHIFPKAKSHVHLLHLLNSFDTITLMVFIFQSIHTSLLNDSTHWRANCKRFTGSILQCM